MDPKSSDSTTAQRSKFFHHNSVSVPIDIVPNSTYSDRIPFGPPVIHAEPEKTMATATYSHHHNSNSVLYTDSLNDHFFNPGGRCIYTFQDQDKEDEKMEME